MGAVTDRFCAAVFASVEWCALDVNVLPDLDLFNERSAYSSPLQRTVVLTHAHRLCAHTCQEANYGHQQELDMIPLMMQKDYSPKGWLGLILGTRMWYATFPAALCLSRLSSLVEMHCQ